MRGSKKPVVNPDMSKIGELWRAEEARENLARVICDENVPPKALCSDNVYFRRVIGTLNPKLCSSFKFQSLEKKCLKVYEEKKVKVQETFSKLGHISLSADILLYQDGYDWESIENYIRIAAHFIDEDWKLRKCVIKYCSVYNDDGDIPADAILKSLDEWNIKRKLFSLTVGKTGDLADWIKEKIEGEKHLPLDGQLFHVQCIGDIISRTAQKGFKAINDIIIKVEELAWSKSEPVWYLTSHKLKEALKLEASGEFSDEMTHKEYDVPTEDEWDKVRNICRIADVIYDIVEPLFEVSKPTANLFLPHLLEIRACLMLESASSHEFVKNVAKRMLKTLDKGWKDMYLVLAIAAFFDPRYKMKFIEHSFSSIEDGDSKPKAAIVRETIHKLYDDYVSQDHQKKYLLTHSSSESEDEEDKEDEDEKSTKRRKKESRKLADRLNVLMKFQCSIKSANDQPHKSDLDLYLEEPILPWSDDFSVLLWWKDNCSKYPSLSRMARDFLAIPMSVSTSYEAYYTEPRQADLTLLSLKPEIKNALACASLKPNYRKLQQALLDAEGRPVNT